MFSNSELGFDTVLSGIFDTLSTAERSDCGLFSPQEVRKITAENTIHENVINFFCFMIYLTA